MRPETDPARMTAGERLREVAAILAAGVLCLRSRAALPSPFTLSHWEREGVREGQIAAVISSPSPTGRGTG